MAKGKKTGGKNFAKGSPGGKPKLTEEISTARHLSYQDLCRAVIRIRQYTVKEIKLLDIDDFPLGERAILNAYLKMDYRGIAEYENRLWGRSIETIDIANMEDIKITFKNYTNKKEG